MRLTPYPGYRSDEGPGGGFRRTVTLLSVAQAGKSPDSGLRLIRATVLMKAPAVGSVEP